MTYAECKKDVENLMELIHAAIDRHAEKACNDPDGGWASELLTTKNRLIRTLQEISSFDDNEIDEMLEDMKTL